MYQAVGTFKGPLDEELKLLDAATVETTGYSDVVDLGENFAPRPALPLGVVINVTALDETTGNETYACEIEESDDDSTYTSTGLSFAIEATGTLHKIFGATKRFVRAALTLGGTTPIITASAWIVRV